MVTAALLNPYLAACRPAQMQAAAEHEWLLDELLAGPEEQSRSPALSSAL